MKCAYGTNCIGCNLTDLCPIYKEWGELIGIGFENNRLNELIDLVKNVLGKINIIKTIDLKNKENQEKLSKEIGNLQHKLSELKIRK